jgi:nucleoside-diphosphate-sugar epimerase
MSKRILLLGCGYLGTQIAQKEQLKGAEVHAIVRTSSSAALLCRSGILAKAIDIDNYSACIENNYAGEMFDTLYYLLPPQAQGQCDKRVNTFLSTLAQTITLKHVVLVSTTGVYGDCEGRWIDEDETLKPVADRAYRRLNSERLWRRFADQSVLSLTILRVAGIYGLGKLPVARLKRKEPVLLSAQSPWSNRIYSKDLLQICVTAGCCEYHGVLNVVDANPSSMTDYFLKVADALSLERPRQISLQEAKKQLSGGILSYLQESRRIGNERLRKELGIQIKYPTLEHGLADIRLGLSSLERQKFAL